MRVRTFVRDAHASLTSFRGVSHAAVLCVRCDGRAGQVNFSREYWNQVFEPSLQEFAEVSAVHAYCFRVFTQRAPMGLRMLGRDHAIAFFEWRCASPRLASIHAQISSLYVPY